MVDDLCEEFMTKLVRARNGTGTFMNHYLGAAGA